MKILPCRWVLTALLASSLLEAQPPDAKTAAATHVSIALKPSHVVTKGGRGTVALKLDGANAAKITDATGRDITSKTRVTPSGAKPDDLTLELARNQIVTLQKDVSLVPASPTVSGRRYLPGTLLVMVDDPKQPGQLALFKGSVFLEMQSKPLQWQAAVKAYTTGLTVGLEADPDSQVSAASFPKSTITLKSTGGARVSKPTIDFTGPGVVSDLVLSVDQPEGVVTVTARYGAQSVDDQAEVAVRAEQLELRAAKNTLLGYGLEQTTLTAVRLDPQGQPLAVATPQEVLFSVTGRGKIEPAQVMIAAGATSAMATFTSESTGKTSVTASIGTRTSAPALFTLTFPASLMLAALIGATVGGICRGFRADVRKRVRWGRLVLEACVTGLLFTAIVFVGLIADILPPALARSEVGVFVVAGIAGFVGASVLDVVTKKLFGEEKKAE